MVCIISNFKWIGKEVLLCIIPLYHLQNELRLLQDQLGVSGSKPHSAGVA